MQLSSTKTFSLQLELLHEYSHPKVLPDDLFEKHNIENIQAYVIMGTKSTGSNEKVPYNKSYTEHMIIYNTIN